MWSAWGDVSNRISSERRAAAHRSGERTPTWPGVRGARKPDVRMVRTAEWKYVHRYPDGPHELFHLTDDPGERTNLIDVPSAQAVAASMKDRLEAWFRTYVNPLRDGAAKGVTGCGQLARVESGSTERPAFADQHLVGADWDLWLRRE